MDLAYALLRNSPYTVPGILSSGKWTLVLVDKLATRAALADLSE
jgi:hypothetical protein